MSLPMRVLLPLFYCFLLACGGTRDGPTDSGLPDGDLDVDGGGGDDRDEPTFLAVTFNTGLHPTVGEQGFTQEMEQYLDDYYGHGLCWGPALEQARAFLQDLSPDIVTFQEIFDVEACADIPAEARADFVGEGLGFHFINPRILSYADLFCIDNLVSDSLVGECWVPGVSPEHAEISPEGYFDHRPTVCEIPLP